MATLERQVLQKRIGEPLATVQTLMQRDKVAWSSGVLATPPVRAIKIRCPLVQIAYPSESSHQKAEGTCPEPRRQT